VPGSPLLGVSHIKMSAPSVSLSSPTMAEFLVLSVLTHKKTTPVIVQTIVDP
jgi:hypothetical protein